MSVECAVTVKCGQETVSITAPYNESLFALLLRRGFLQHRDTACGGCGLCGKCTVKAAGRLSKMNAEERSMLGDELVSKGYRLACCCYIKGDCTITVPDKREASQKNAESVQRGYGISMDIGDSVVTASLQDLSKIYSWISFRRQTHKLTWAMPKTASVSGRRAERQSFAPCSPRSLTALRTSSCSKTA